LICHWSSYTREADFAFAADRFFLTGSHAQLIFLSNLRFGRLSCRAAAFPLKTRRSPCHLLACHFMVLVVRPVLSKCLDFDCSGCSSALESSCSGSTNVTDHRFLVIRFGVDCCRLKPVLFLSRQIKRLEGSWFKSLSRGDFLNAPTSCSVKYL
jgi:hypothetical protein